MWEASPYWRTPSQARWTPGEFTWPAIVPPQALMREAAKPTSAFSLPTWFFWKALSPWRAWDSDSAWKREGPSPTFS